MIRRCLLYLVPLAVVVAVTAFVTHRLVSSYYRDMLDAEYERARLRGQQTAGELFEVVEAEYKRLGSMVDLPLDDKPKSTIREGMVFCVMMMKECARRNAYVVRAGPINSQNLEVTEEWVRPYVDRVAEYPEWAKRHDLVATKVFW